MKKKISTSICAVLLAMLMLVSCVMLTACGGEMSVKDFKTATGEATKNWYNTHNSYETFADTTFTINAKTVVDTEQELTFKKNASDTTTVTEGVKFTNTMNKTQQVAIKSSGEDKILFLKQTTINEINGYKVENELLVADTNKTTNVVEVTYGKVESNYFVTRYTYGLNAENNKQNEVKTYYAFSSQSEYEQEIVEVMQSINLNLIMTSSQMINNSIYSNEVDEKSFTNNNGEVKAELKVASFGATPSMEYYDTVSTMVVTIKDKQLASSSFAYNMTQANGYVNNKSMSYAIANSATVDAVSTEGYTASDLNSVASFSILSLDF